MKIPKEDSAKLDLYREVIQQCFYSQKMRIAQYDTLRHYYIYGTAPESDPTPYNKIDPIVDTLSAFLYSADSTRFSTHLSPGTDEQEWDKAEPVSEAINTEWMDTGTDQQFAGALDWSMVYGSMFIKTIVKVVGKTAELSSPVVEPHCIGLYREDICGLDKQEAIAHRYYITKGQLEEELSSHPNKDAIMESIAPKPIRVRDEMPDTLRRIIITNMAGSSPLSPGNTITGGANITTSDRVDYTPAIIPDAVEMTELWIRDGDLADYRTVTMAESQIVIYDRENIFVKNHQPFTQVCPLPMQGYAWGMSFVGKVMGLQGWRNLRVDEIKRILALQAKPPTALTGFTGMVDETDFALNQPGGVLNNTDPMGKVERFDKPVPGDLWADVAQIDEMFMEGAGLSPVLMGRGESGVRSGRQTSELSRLGSSRTKKRALAIEDNLETLATKMYRALRKYDATNYETKPSKEGVKPMKFILAQTPDDTTIRVDGHSNSPLFIEDLKQVAAGLLEAKAINRGRLIKMVNPPGKEVMLKELTGIEQKEAAAAKAHTEQEMQLAAAKHGAPPGQSGAPPQRG